MPGTAVTGAETEEVVQPARASRAAVKSKERARIGSGYSLATASAILANPSRFTIFASPSAIRAAMPGP